MRYLRNEVAIEAFSWLGPRQVRHIREGTPKIISSVKPRPRARRADSSETLAEAIAAALERPLDEVRPLLEQLPLTAAQWRAVFIRRGNLLDERVRARFSERWADPLNAITYVMNGVRSEETMSARRHISISRFPEETEGKTSKHLHGEKIYTSVSEEPGTVAEVEWCYFPLERIWLPVELRFPGRVVGIRTALDAKGRLLAIGRNWSGPETLAALYREAAGDYKIFLRYPPGESVTLGQRPRSRGMAKKETTLPGGSGLFEAPGRAGELAVFTASKNGIVKQRQFISDTSSELMRLAVLRDERGRVTRVIESHRHFSDKRLQELYAEFGPFWLENLFFTVLSGNTSLSAGAKHIPKIENPPRAAETFYHAYYYGDDGEGSLAQSIAEGPGSFLIGEYGVPVFIRAGAREPEFLIRVEIRDETGKVVDVVDSSRSRTSYQNVERALVLAEMSPGRSVYVTRLPVSVSHDWVVNPLAVSSLGNYFYIPAAIGERYVNQVSNLYAEVRYLRGPDRKPVPAGFRLVSMVPDAYHYQSMVTTLLEEFNFYKNPGGGYVISEQPSRPPSRLTRSNEIVSKGESLLRRAP